MKLLKKNFDKDGSGFVVLVPEESDDLWQLYNLIAAGDDVRAATVRKVQVGDRAGVMDKKHITLTLLVKSVDFDAKGDCLRIAGTNNSENEFVKMGAHHTLEINLNTKLTKKFMKEIFKF